MAAPLARFFRFLPGGTGSMLCRACQAVVQCNLESVGVRWNSNRTAVAKTNRKVYTRQYPVLMVNPDGSTFRIKYKEPMKIIKLPVDIDALTFEERKRRLSRYQVRKKRNIADDIADDADVANKYRHLWKKK